MGLQAVYESQEDIPETFRELYSERNGKFELTGIDGVRTQADVERVQEGLRKEREDHGKTRERLKPWEGLDPEETRTKLDRYDEFELTADGKIDDEKINTMVEARMKGRVAPLERKAQTLEEELVAERQKTAEFVKRENRRTIHDTVREAMRKAKVSPEAEPDVLLNAETMLEVGEDGRVVARDGVGVTPGIEADLWLSEMQPKRPLWWPLSAGGGAGGGKVRTEFGLNPWSGEHWNVGRQGQIYREQGEEKARQMAKAVGVDFDRPVRPKIKT